MANIDLLKDIYVQYMYTNIDQFLGTILYALMDNIVSNFLSLQVYNIVHIEYIYVLTLGPYMSKKKRQYCAKFPKSDAYFGQYCPQNICSVYTKTGVHNPNATKSHVWRLRAAIY